MAGIVAGLKSIGRDVRDVKFIAVSHAHFDHVGGVAALARMSGATVLSTAAGAVALNRGTVPKDDPQAGYGDFMQFPPAANTRALTDGESITLGDTTLTPPPGHTPGGASWTWRDCEGERCVDLVYADSLTPVSDDHYRFADGDRAATLRASIGMIRTLPCDVLVSAHPDFSKLFERQASRQLVDPTACTHYADSASERLDRRLREEAANRRD